MKRETERERERRASVRTPAAGERYRTAKCVGQCTMCDENFQYSCKAKRRYTYFFSKWSPSPSPFKHSKRTFVSNQHLSHLSPQIPSATHKQSSHRPKNYEKSFVGCDIGPYTRENRLSSTHSFLLSHGRIYF